MSRRVGRAALVLVLTVASSTLVYSATAWALSPDPAGAQAQGSPIPPLNGRGSAMMSRRTQHLTSEAMPSTARGEHRPGAAEPAEEEAGEPAAVNWLDFRNKEQPPFLAAFINAAIVAFIYYYWGRKPIRGALKARREEITRQMDEAKAIRREAEARSKEYAARLAGLDQEVVGTKAALAEVGEGEKARIVREAEEKGERMRKDAVFLLEQERKQARIDLQRDAVQRALADAEGLLRTRLTPADHERIAEEFLAGIAAPSATPARPAGGES